MYLIRVPILDSWANIPTTDAARQLQNAFAHGGQVLSDIAIIKEKAREDLDKAAMWKDGFTKAYVADFDLYACHIETAPPQLISIMKFHADLFSLYQWEGNGCRDHYAQRWMQAHNHLLDVLGRRRQKAC